MRHNRLKLVDSDDNVNGEADAKSDGLAAPATPASGIRPLRVVDAEGASLPDDAA